jgi:hypothetical protein
LKKAKEPDVSLEAHESSASPHEVSEHRADPYTCARKYAADDDVDV